MITDPEEFVSPPTDSKLPWVYFEIDDDRRMNEEGLDLLYSWVKSARSNENLYTSRLGGLVRVSQNVYAREIIPSSFASYVIHCANFVEDMKHNKISYENEIASNAEMVVKLPKKEELNSVIIAPKMEETNFDLNRIEKSINQIEKQDDINVNSDRPNFDCEIIRGYREINAGDTQLNLVSNRDLIIKLGLGFEEMGNGVMDQIRKKDPLFYRYFNSLRAIEESPLN